MESRQLTTVEKQRLRTLERRLDNCVALGRLTDVNSVAIEIQELLRSAGHSTRLMQIKNRVFEAHMEAGELDYAASGFLGIREKVSKNTRLYLESTALLAICKIRSGKIPEAKLLIEKVIKNQKAIRSDRQRFKFRREVIARFDQEVALAELRRISPGIDSQLDLENIQHEAGMIIATKNEDEIYAIISESTPPQVLNAMKQIHEFAKQQLSAQDRKLLNPPTQIASQKIAEGRTIFGAFKRVLYRSLCDSTSDVYKLWFQGGIQAVLDKKYVTAAIVAGYTGLGIGFKPLIVSAVALVIKLGIEVYCERSKPERIMDMRVRERRAT